MKVYIVTSGSYSDHQVEQVFLSEEDAQTYISDRENNYSDYSYAEYEAFDHPVCRQCFQWYQKSWNAEHDHYWDYSSREDDDDTRTTHEWHKDGRGSDVLRVEGTDLESVNKVLSDQKAMYLARKEGIA